MLVEEYLDGPEASVFCISDGPTVVPLLPGGLQARGNGDTGPNTGGMGAYCPLWAAPDLAQWTIDHVAQPAIDEMAMRGSPHRRALRRPRPDEHRPRVVEFNARFGDPETQAVLALLETPLAVCSRLRLAGVSWPTSRRFGGAMGRRSPWSWRRAGYPQSPRTGDVITGADAPGVLHAGTALRDGEIAGRGRVSTSWPPARRWNKPARPLRPCAASPSTAATTGPTSLRSFRRSPDDPQRVWPAVTRRRR